MEEKTTQALCLIFLPSSCASGCFVKWCNNLPNYKPCNKTRLPPTQHLSTKFVCKQQNKVCLRNFRGRFKLQLSAAGLVWSHERGWEHQTKAATALWERAHSGLRSKLLTVTPTENHLFLTETRCDDTRTRCLLDYHRVMGSTLSFGICHWQFSLGRSEKERGLTHRMLLELGELNINVEASAILCIVLSHQP